jgi:HSP20 family protein
MKARDLIPWNRGKHEVQMRGRSTERGGGLPADVNRAFEEFWRSFTAPLSFGRFDLGDNSLPRVDVRETDKEVDVQAELPGMDDADIDVSVADGALVIRGEKKDEHDTQDRGFLVKERTFGRVERVVPLPDGLDLDAAKASFKNGVLTVAIPRTSDAQKGVKHVAVQRA